MLSIVCFHSYGQSISYDSFQQRKRNIDSLTKQIDDNPELVERRINGSDSIYGQYNGTCVYSPRDKSVLKIECTFLFRPTGVNLFYFQKDNLVKLVYKQTILYCIDNIIIDEVGTVVKVGEGINLWQFQNRIRPMLKSIFED